MKLMLIIVIAKLFNIVISLQKYSECYESEIVDHGLFCGQNSTSKCQLMCTEITKKGSFIENSFLVKIGYSPSRTCLCSKINPLNLQLQNEEKKLECITGNHHDMWCTKDNSTMAEKHCSSKVQIPNKTLFYIEFNPESYYFCGHKPKQYSFCEEENNHSSYCSNNKEEKCERICKENKDKEGTSEQLIYIQKDPSSFCIC